VGLASRLALARSHTHGGALDRPAQATRVTSGGASFVAVEQTADFRERNHTTFSRTLHTSPCGRIFREGEMGPRSVIVRNVSGEHAPQVRLVEDDHVVKALAANRSDQARRIRILPRT
jgi:hypothetical protein